MRSSSSFSSCFFFRSCSRAFCCAAFAEETLDFGSLGMAFCLPLDFGDWGRVEAIWEGDMESLACGSAGGNGSAGAAAALPSTLVASSPPRALRSLRKKFSPSTPLKICSRSCPLLSKERQFHQCHITTAAYVLYHYQGWNLRQGTEGSEKAGFGRSSLEP